MDNYKDLYYLLFNRVSDIIEQLKNIQQISEEMFITFPETQKNNTETNVYQTQKWGDCLPFLFVRQTGTGVGFLTPPCGYLRFSFALAANH